MNKFAWYQSNPSLNQRNKSISAQAAVILTITAAVLVALVVAFAHAI